MIESSPTVPDHVLRALGTFYAIDPALAKAKVPELTAEAKICADIAEDRSAKHAHALRLVDEANAFLAWVVSQINARKAESDKLRADAVNAVQVERAAFDFTGFANKAQEDQLSVELLQAAQTDVTRKLNTELSWDVISAEALLKYALAEEQKTLAILSHTASIAGLEAVWQAQGSIIFVGGQTLSMLSASEQLFKRAEFLRLQVEGLRHEHRRQQQQLSNSSSVSKVAR